MPFEDTAVSFDRADPIRILVTGATGFVGSHVLEAFARTTSPVRALVRPTPVGRQVAGRHIEVAHGTLEDPGSLRRAVDGVDVIVHLAARTRAHDAAEYHRANAVGSRNLLDAALVAEPRPRRIVYLSSLAAAGPCINGRPVEPGDTPRPLTAYGRSKLAGERVFREADDALEIAILRAPAVYGPRERDLYHFFRLAARGVVPVPVGPARPLQLVHVEDLADAVVRAAVTPEATGVFHVAEPDAYAWEHVARLVADAVGVRARVVRVPPALIRFAAAASETMARATGRPSIFNRDKARELLAPGWLCETERAREVLGFTARIPLERGLRETAQWYRNEGWL